MGMNINTSIPALQAQREIAKTQGAMARQAARLASGKRITSAADDAAGLSIAETMQAQIRQYNQESSNLQYGLNAVQTADQAIGTQQQAVGRIQELATQAASGTLNADQRAALNNEAQQLLQQINQTAQDTEFNGQKLLNGSTAAISLGTASGEQAVMGNTTAGALGLGAVDLTTQQGAQQALGAIENATSQISQERASLGSQQNRFASAIEVRETAAANTQESESRIRDLDIAAATMEQTRTNMMLRQSLSALIQGNIVPQAAASLLTG